MRPVISVDVKWNDRGFLRQVDNAVEDSLRTAAGQLESDARSSSSRYRIDEIIASAKAGSVYKGRRGRPSIDVYLTHPLGLIFEGGRRRREGVGRLKPGRFLKRALPPARDRLMSELRQRIPG